MITLVKFYAEWCKPCTAFSPIIDAYIDKHDDVMLTSVNIDLEPNLVAEYGVQIQTIPFLVLIQEGNIIAVHIGSMTYTELEIWIDSLRKL